MATYLEDSSGEFTQSLGTSGWSKQPNGLILQWVNFNTPSEGFSGGTIYYDFPITFPISFNTVYSCVAGNSTTDSSAAADRTVRVRSMTNSGCIVAFQNSAGFGFIGILSCSVFALGI